jgi:hypothetical protein
VELVAFMTYGVVLLLVVMEVGREFGGVTTGSAGVLQLILKLMDIVL